MLILRAMLAALLLAALHPTAAADSVPASASPEAAFSAANELYRGGKFAEALAAYERIARDGVESGILYYNMGTAAAKVDKKPLAVLYFERALRLMPRLREARENLAKVQSSTDEPRRVSLAELPGQWLSRREWLFVFAVSYLAFGGAGALYFAARPRGASRVRKTLFAASAAVLAVAAAGCGAVAWRDGFQGEAIVMSDEVSAHSGPGAAFTRLAVLPAGERVQKLDYDDPKWVRIRLPGGRAAFVATGSIQTI